MSDYLNAITACSGGISFHTPIEMFRVLLARFVYNMGPRWYSLYSLDRIEISQWANFLLNERFKQNLRKLNGKKGREIVRDKLKFYGHCLEADLETIPVYCVIGADCLERASHFAYISEDAWVEFSLSFPGRLFVKLITGSGGIDAMSIYRAGGSWMCEGTLMTHRELFSFLRQRLRGREGWIVQPVIENHQAMRKIMGENALSTVRMVTVQEENRIRGAVNVLRIPVGRNLADNFEHGCSGNLVAPVNPESGVLGVATSSRSASWPVMGKVTRHPDTQEMIEGFEIPFWKEAKELVLRAHATLSDMKSIGWDIAITDDGPLIVEANGQYDIDLLQVAYGRGLKYDLQGVVS